MLGKSVAHRILSSEAHLSACLERYDRGNLMYVKCLKSKNALFQSPK